MPIQRKKLSLITLSHTVTDFYPGFVPVMLPVLVTQYGFSLSSAATLVSILGISCNFTQPLFGYLFDKKKYYLLFLAPLVTALFLSAMPLTTNYFLMVLFLLIGGAGVGMFHPEAAHIARNCSSAKRELSLSVFLGGGTAGYALGACSGGVVIDAWGVKALSIFALFGFLISLILWVNRKEMRSVHDKGKPSSEHSDKTENNIPAFIAIFSVVTAVVSVHAVIAAYLPLFLMERGYSVSAGGFALLLYIVPGSLAGIWAGRLALHYSPRLLVSLSLLASFFFLVLFLSLPDPFFLLCIPFAGAMSLFAFPLLVHDAYAHLPEKSGFVGGSVIGLSWGGACFVVLGTGILADISDSLTLSFWFTSLFLFYPLWMLGSRRILFERAQ